MKGAHAYFSGSAGVRLHYRCWDVPSPRAVTMIAHGLGEHSGRYEELAQDLTRAGISAYALDHRGHGRSDGRRGHVRRFSHYIHDFEKFRRRVVGSVGSAVPLIVLGHSLGGLIVARYLQEFPAVPVRGAILSAPALGFALDVPRWKAQMARVLYYAVPALPMSTGIDPEALTHDRQVVEAYERDPLVHDRITPRLYGELETEIETVFERAGRLTLPILVLVPSDDRIARADRMQSFASRIGDRRRVKVETFPGFYHEVLNEIGRASVVADLLGWIERRIETGVSAGGGGGGLAR
ncbi:MAG: alpha/beta hydrolase [Gemmatimonadetes bacterium]|uniref:Alpha/beta hydrolase n=1 Tax=Candidatus Kutchimonas denitrificans TaxID=3056748 RepID=A0AAE4Z749_9BACT|nr:alpha/beta hydrolase [Gemmatimonadota bacterium]NIR74979.1 alpha/beta hydrolase [Candidatus Kutchimonas denitrificans]NIS01562.1 alpha/beta hydrolase [Gemmatimonadota bacterium]NIT67300.1 alpha/beta hydrolase [Gemmatimonadota bacterium]NIU52663.1 alpha/beta fold hydrolase [Gemmatimonadota bacterium]